MNQQPTLEQQAIAAWQRRWNAAEISANAARLAFGTAPLRQLDQAPSFAQRVRGGL